MLLISFPLVLAVNHGRATDERRRNGVELHRFLCFFSVLFSFLLVFVFYGAALSRCLLFSGQGFSFSSQYVRFFFSLSKYLGITQSSR